MEVYGNSPLDKLYGEEIVRKLNILQETGNRVRHVIEDYLGNEGTCIMTFPQFFPEERKREFEIVCQTLREKTVEEIVSLLEGGIAVLDEGGTNANRDFVVSTIV